MSRLFDRLSDCVKHEISTDDAIALWNHFAEQNSYERIYDMRDFDEIVGTDRSFRDVMNDLTHGFDHNAGYFYEDSAYGTWTSTDAPFEVIDINQLVEDLIDSEGNGYPSVSTIEEYFDGYLFEIEMKSVLEKLSAEEIKYMASQLWDSQNEFNESEINNPKDPQDFVYDRLEELFYGYDFAPVYMMPEAVQDKFFELKNPNLDYLKDNIGNVNGRVPAEKALELAGFEHPAKAPKDIYVFNYGQSFERFEIKIKNGEILSAEPVNQKKQAAVR